MYTVTSYCPCCGASIYVNSPWWGICPPPPIYSCWCSRSVRIVTTPVCRTPRISFTPISFTPITHTTVYLPSVPAPRQLSKTRSNRW